MTYKQALAAPTSKGGRGWAHADGESLLAAAAEIVGTALVLNPEAIYEWAQKFNLTFRDLNRLRRDDSDVILLGVLNDDSPSEVQTALANQEEPPDER
jgi:hypothetical protein